MTRLARLACRLLLGKSGKTAFDAASVKRILILRNDKIGDMIVSTPLFRELKRHYPGVVIDVAASSVNQEVVRACPHIGEVLVWDKKQGAAYELKRILAIRRRRYDVIFDASNRFSIAFLLGLKLLRARYLIGFETAKYQTSTAALGMFDRTVVCDRRRPILHSYFAALAPFGLRDIDHRYELFGVEAHAAKALRFCAGLRARYQGIVCFNYQGSSAGRTLTRDDAAGFCRAVARNYPHHAVVVLYPPGGRAQAQAIVDQAGGANVLLSFDTANVMELAALLRECDVAVSPDTAVIHLASAYNKKILGFYINTDNYHWYYPASDRFQVLLSARDSIGAIDVARSLRAFDELMRA